MIFLWIGLYASHDFSQQRKVVRFKHSLDCSFEGDKLINGKTIDFSEYGMMMESDTEIETFNANDRGIVSLKQLGIANIPARMIRPNPGLLLKEICIS